MSCTNIKKECYYTEEYRFKKMFLNNKESDNFNYKKLYYDNIIPQSLLGELIEQNKLSINDIYVFNNDTKYLFKYITEDMLQDKEFYCKIDCSILEDEIIKEKLNDRHFNYFGKLKNKPGYFTDNFNELYDAYWDKNNLSTKNYIEYLYTYMYLLDSNDKAKIKNTICSFELINSIDTFALFKDFIRILIELNISVFENINKPPVSVSVLKLIQKFKKDIINEFITSNVSYNYNFVYNIIRIKLLYLFTDTEIRDIINTEMDYIEFDRFFNYFAKQKYIKNVLLEAKEKRNELND